MPAEEEARSEKAEDEGHASLPLPLPLLIMPAVEIWLLPLLLLLLLLPGATDDGCNEAPRVRAQSHTNGAAARHTRHTCAAVTPPVASACTKCCGDDDAVDAEAECWY